MLTQLTNKLSSRKSENGWRSLGELLMGGGGGLGSIGTPRERPMGAGDKMLN